LRSTTGGRDGALGSPDRDGQRRPRSHDAVDDLEEPVVSSAPVPRRVVIVDDAPEFRALLRAVLAREADLTVVAVAADGEEGLTAVHGHAPDVVVTDLQMPGMDGLEFTRVLRRLRPDLPIVMVTGFPGPEAMDAAFDAGVTAFLEKATGVERLAALVRDVLAGDDLIDVSDVARWPEPPALTSR
jgi:two-component system, NarL family, response regulator DesR